MDNEEIIRAFNKIIKNLYVINPYINEYNILDNLNKIITDYLEMDRKLNGIKNIII